MKVAVIYLIAAFLVQIVGSSLATFEINNMPTFHIFAVVQFALLSLFFRLLIKPLWIKWVIEVNILYFVLYAIVNAIFVEGIYEFNSYVATAEAILLLVYSVVFLAQMLRNMPVDKVERSFSFWIVSGTLFYFAGNFFLFMLANFLIQSEAHSLADYWDIHSANLILYYAAFTIALFQKSGRKNLSVASQSLKILRNGTPFQLNC